MIIRIIGCGSIGSALAQNLSENGKKVILFDIHPERAEALARAIQASVCASPCDDLALDETILNCRETSGFSNSGTRIAYNLREFGGKRHVWNYNFTT